MSTGVPALPLELDPLITEAKQRARRRRILVLGAIVVVASAPAVWTTRGLWSPSNELGVCATVPAGWTEHVATGGGFAARWGAPATVITDYRFGVPAERYGLDAPDLWPRDRVLIGITNEAPSANQTLRSALTVSRSDFHVESSEGGGSSSGISSFYAFVAVRSQGRILDATVRVGSVTRGTIADANRALAGVRTCSA